MSSANSFRAAPLLEEVKQVSLRGTVTPPSEVPRYGQPPPGPFGGRLTTFLILAAPSFWLGWLTFQYGIDTPWGDHWDATRLLLQKMAAGTLRFADFFAFHNEHRILFPQLLSFAIGRLTHWNIRAELFVIWILLCVVGLNIWRVAQISGWRNSPASCWLLLGANILIFSPLQWENMLWGFQIGFLLPLATMTASVWTARCFRYPLNFVVTAALCLISTFSIASGLASWFLATPLLLIGTTNPPARGEKTWWIAWTALAVASLCIYFHGYKHPAAHPSLMLVFQHPISASQFLFAYIGNPFRYDIRFDHAVIAQIAGAALLALLFVAIVYLCRSWRDRALLADTLPWITIIGFALANAVLTTFGRVGFGMRGALQSRYVSFAILLPVGLLFLAPLLYRHWKASRPPQKHVAQLLIAFVSFLTALGFLFGATTMRSLKFWRLFHHELLTSKATLLFINVINDPEAVFQHIHWSHWTLKDWANSLDRIGYLHPPLVRSPYLREIAGKSSEGGFGEFNKFLRTSRGELFASGWAILPSRHRAADSVLLAYDNAGGEPIVFARVDVTEERGDVGQRLHDTEYNACGWVKIWKPEQLPVGTRRITAWAFDAEECRAYAIGGATL